MKEKSLTTSLQSLHKRQSEYYVKLEKCLSEEKRIRKESPPISFVNILYH